MPKSLITLSSQPVRRIQERVLNFGSYAGGGMIAFEIRDNRLWIEVHRTDDTVTVKHTSTPPVFVLRHDTRHGATTTVHASRGDATSTAARTVRLQWDNITGDGIPRTPDGLSDTDVVDLYFAHCGDDETLDIVEHDVQAGLVQNATDTATTPRGEPFMSSDALRFRHGVHPRGWRVFISRPTGDTGDPVPVEVSQPSYFRVSDGVAMSGTPVEFWDGEVWRRAVVQPCGAYLDDVLGGGATVREVFDHRELPPQMRPALSS